MNSVEAEATRIIIALDELKSVNLLSVRIKDNGRGMSDELVQRVLDPFVTTRTTRSVGMGLSMFRQIARQCGGDLQIFSAPGIGTLVRTTFRLNNLNLPPIGKMSDSIVNLFIGSIDVHFYYAHKTDHGQFGFDSYWLFARMAEKECQLVDTVPHAKEYLNRQLQTIKSRAT
ncbi:ATP-binding protein [candidate division KSB1 bacterium]|nr:ATP-binding protein [candidate division KSB1 bacterium]